jgi:kumamolisin
MIRHTVFGTVMRVLAASVMASTLVLLGGPAQAGPLLTRHARDVVTSGRAQPMARLPQNQVMDLDVVLALRDRPGLQLRLREIQDRTSPRYRRFLSAREFTEQFGPTAEDYAAVVNLAKANGFDVVGGTRDGMNVQIRGPVSAVEHTFHVRLYTYRHPTADRTFFAPDREPSVDLPFALWAISGLDNLSIPRPASRAIGSLANQNSAYAPTGSGPNGLFLGSDLRAAYADASTPLTGAGQRVGIFSFVGYDPADIGNTFGSAGQAESVPITAISTDGASTSCIASQGCDDAEPTLDITESIGMAPGLAGVTLYVGKGGITDWPAIFAYMTTDYPLPLNLSSSWTWEPADATAADTYFERMASQGQTFFQASGDWGTWSAADVEGCEDNVTPPKCIYPADSPYVTSVGGTQLTTVSPGGPWSSEIAWNQVAYNGISSGGGFSPHGFAIPQWQTLPGIINSANQGSTTLRNGPDVSANADYFYLCFDQLTTCAGRAGSSGAAPLWAGLNALLNEEFAAKGDGPVGFITPFFYDLNGQTQNPYYSEGFHDITVGTSGSHSATTGFDLVTGWGTPKPGFLTTYASLIPGPDFQVTASPATLTVHGRSGGSSTVAITGGCCKAPVALSTADVPSGWTVTFNPSSITEPQRSTMTIDICSGKKGTGGATGTYTFYVIGTESSENLSNYASVTVTTGGSCTVVME